MMTRTFTIYPAIDVLDGRVVRLAEGDRKRVTVEGGDPVAAAERFSAEGASWLHVVDLDGAFSGTPSPGLVDAVGAGAVPVQVGGGYRSLDAVQAGLAAGAARVIVGSSALDAIFLEEAARTFAERLVVAVDVRDGRIAVSGWTELADVSPAELGRRCAAAGVVRLLVTSTHRDGSLAGPDLPLLDDVLAASGLPLLAAGGIASVDDLLRLRELGCEGAVVGSALWLGRFTLADALRLER